MKIGGFFALEAPAASVNQSLFDLWALSTVPHVAFSNGRSVLAATVQMLAPRTAWLPSYCCDSLAEAINASGAALRYYDVDALLSPDSVMLDEAAPGDMVLVIDYFGRNPSSEFLAYRASRPELHWIEDRAQALYPAREPWGDYVLYTPRKLIGVGDGGIMASRTKPLPPAPAARTENPGPDHPAVLRAQDVGEEQNAVWHKANQRFEAAQQVEHLGMSAQSLALLQQLDAPSMIRRRQENDAFLRHQLGEIAALPTGGGVPFGFPIRIAQRAKLAAHLASQGVFAAHHWPHLPSPRELFPQTHAAAEELLTLPCDHRYGPVEMERIATLVRGWL